MKVFNYTTDGNPCYGRIIGALKRYAPKGISFTDVIEEADLVILHANGRRKHMKRMAVRSPKYVVAQYCLRTTMEPTTDAWRDLWEGAEFVWSYLDLNEEVKKDGE